MDSELFNLLLGTLTLIITVGGGFLVKFINQKIGIDKSKHYYDLAKKIVMTIEQLNPELLGPEKKEIAISKLVALTNNKLSPEQADLLIESAVYEVKKFLNG